MKKYQRIDLTGTVSLDYPMGGNCVSGQVGTLGNLSICPGRIEPTEAIRKAEENGGEVLLSDQGYFQDNFMGMCGRRDFLEGRVRAISGNNEQYEFRQRGSRRWISLSYSRLQELMIKKVV